MKSAPLPRLLRSSFEALLQDFPAVAVIGPRQAGKTTFVRTWASAQPAASTLYLDLERPSDLLKLSDPELFLGEHTHQTVILDEVQRLPGLFQVLRSLIDEDRRPGRFVLLGSASPELLRQTAESLAGRIVYLELQPLHVRELPDEIPYQTHWFRGGFPDALMARSARSLAAWQRSFIQTYIERDLALLGLSAPPALIRTLLIMLSSLQGQMLNMQAIARSLGASHALVSTCLEYLEHAFMIRRLPAFHANLKKRLVKSPKLYLRDSGLLHYLAGIPDLESLQGHILLGSSWEGYVIQQILANTAPDIQPYYYRTQDGTEADLVLCRGPRVEVSVEIKYASAPQLSRGTYQAVADLQPRSALIVTPSAGDFPVREGIRVCSLYSLWDHLRALDLLAD